jgi:SAM-dependent methyltransferase
VDQEAYDSEYFDVRGAHLKDPDAPFQRYRVEKVLGLYEPGREDRVVDLGCGWGTFDFALAPRVREMVGVDFSERSVALCNRRLEREPRANLRFVCADARRTGLEDGAWDLVIAADLFEHLYPDQSEEVVREAWRLLRPGGRLSIWTPHRGHLLEVLKNNNIVLRADPTHVDYKSRQGLETMLEEVGFLVEKSYYAESHLPVLRDIERSLLAWVPFLRRRIAVLGRKPL